MQTPGEEFVDEYLRHINGSWWEFFLYDFHQAAGTWMAISTLVRTLPK